jgi:Zn finger protein HypA/HybF involved in hydrogenase expression
MEEKNKIRRSVFWVMPKEDLIKLLDQSDSIADVLRKFELSTTGGCRKTLEKVIEGRGIDLEFYKIKYRKIQSNKNIRRGAASKIPLSSLLVENSTHSNSGLKSKVCSAGLLKDECRECGLLPNWNDKPITLQLDHINGVNDDNRIENLRILCPNCHSQTDTFGRKRRLKTKVACVNCPNTKTKSSQFCKECIKKNRITKAKKKFDIPAKELYDLVWVKKLPYTTIGTMLGVSDNAVRKRSVNLGIPVRKSHKQ